MEGTILCQSLGGRVSGRHTVARSRQEKARSDPPVQILRRNLGRGKSCKVACFTCNSVRRGHERERDRQFGEAAAKMRLVFCIIPLHITLTIGSLVPGTAVPCVSLCRRPLDAQNQFPTQPKRRFPVSCLMMCLMMSSPKCSSFLCPSLKPRPPAPASHPTPQQA